MDGFDDRFVLMNELTHGYKFESLLIAHDQDVVEKCVNQPRRLTYPWQTNDERCGA